MEKRTKQSLASPVSANVEGEEVFNEAKGFTLETEVVYREKVKIPFTETGTGTIGDMIDRQIADLAKHDGEMRHFGITFDEASWNDAKEAYKNYEAPDRRFR
jgi:hypothetical protein